MAVTAAQIKAEFPEFADTADADIDAKIADAVSCVNVDAWGDQTDFGVKYMAAHLLAISPLAECAKLDTDGNTVYLTIFERKKRTVASGCRVI